MKQNYFFSLILVILSIGCAYSDICEYKNGQVVHIGTAGGDCGIWNNHRRVKRQKYDIKDLQAGQMNNFKPDNVAVGHMDANRVNSIGQSGQEKGFLGKLKNSIFGNGPPEAAAAGGGGRNQPPHRRERAVYPIDKINAGIVNNFRRRRDAPKYQMGNVRADTVNNF